VIEAQARRGIVIGQLFPQQQDGVGGYTRNELSTQTANQQNIPGFSSGFDEWQVGFDAIWELDVWGRFRRGIEVADAQLLAAVASYDDVLVSLIAEVATNYLFLRILEERLEVANANVAIQRRSYEIADAKFEGGAVTELDAAQAAALLRNTQAQVPELEIAIRQTQNTLCVLLGMAPRDLQDMLGASGTIPTTPAEVAVGIPADLLRRRPDIRRAERVLAAQSAEIGVATADLFPSFSLFGSLGIKAEDFPDLFTTAAIESFAGPQVRWAILNYGRIQNNIRVQDARFQALVSEYENTVLRAQKEVEDAIAAYLGTQRQVTFLQGSVEAATRAVELADFQYREGATDYTRVITTQQFLVNEQDRLVATRGAVVLNLVTLYRALGGGWESRIGKDFVSDKTKAQMQERTRWKDLLLSTEQAADLTAAEHGTASDRTQWRWREWKPKW
jgi:NodT family efflux transporter outer membrane factor (OMF) lipoprotein